MNQNDLPAVQGASAVIDYSNPEMIRTLKATVAVGATDAEFAMFAGLAKSTGLNPFKREIWFIKTPGYRKKDGTTSEPKVQIMTGILGFLAIANSHPQFDGMECEVERNKDGKPIKATAKVYRKDRRFPSVSEAIWSEDSQPTESYHGKAMIWGKMPSVMLSKVAKSRALREAFPQELGGLYTQEEMPAEYSIEPQADQSEAKPEPKPEAPRTIPANERIEPDLAPDKYRLQAPKSQHKGRELMEIHRLDPKWIPAVLADKRRAAACTQRDMANLKAFAIVMQPVGGNGNNALMAEELAAMDDEGMFNLEGE